MGKYRSLGTLFNRMFRNDLNANFDSIDSDIKTQKTLIDADLNTQKTRVDNLIVGTPQPSEVVDSRGGFPVLRDRLNGVDTSLAERATKTDVTNSLLQKRDTSTKLIMEDMSAAVVSAMTGGATVNLNSIPQDNTVDSKKAIYKSLNVDRLSDISFTFAGDEVYEKSGADTDPLYYGMVYDTNGLGLVGGETITFSFDFIIADPNAIALYTKCFQNNDATTENILGGILDLNQNGRVSIIQKGINNFKCTMTNTYDATYRYVKPFACVDLTDKTQYSTYYITNITCLVGTTPLTYVTKGLYAITGGSITTVTNKHFDWQLVKQSDISSIVTTKWNGKKANFLGDSITQGLYYNGSSYVTATKPWHQHLKELLGLSVARNYGVSGTHISGAYTVSDGESDQTNNFVSRYPTMDNDADLIVVFGGTNDFGHSATAPFGTMADRTDISFYGGLHVLMSGLVNKYLGKTIVFMTPLHRSGDETPNSIGKVLKDYVNAIKQVAEYYGIYVLDTYATSGLTTQVAAVQTTYMNDGLHPNEVGHEYLGNKITPFLKAI
jgi:lysophospholipase L1-like esterase